MGGGAWPFLVGGVICLVNSVNERDLSLLTSRAYPLSPKISSEIGRGMFRIGWCFLLDSLPGLSWRASYNFLEGLSVCSGWKFEAITGL